MGKVYLSLIINFLVSFSVLGGDDSSIGFGLFVIFASGWVVSVIGVVCYQNNQARWAYITAAIGFTIFIPIGLLGLFGLQQDRSDRDKQKLLDRLATKKSTEQKGSRI